MSRIQIKTNKSHHANDEAPKSASKGLERIIFVISHQADTNGWMRGEKDDDDDAYERSDFFFEASTLYIL